MPLDRQWWAAGWTPLFPKLSPACSYCLRPRGACRAPLGTALKRHCRSRSPRRSPWCLGVSKTWTPRPSGAATAVGPAHSRAVPDPALLSRQRRREASGAPGGARALSSGRRPAVSQETLASSTGSPTPELAGGCACPAPARSPARSTRCPGACAGGARAPAPPGLSGNDLGWGERPGRGRGLEPGAGRCLAWPSGQWVGPHWVAAPWKGGWTSDGALAPCLGGALAGGVVDGILVRDVVPGGINGMGSEFPGALRPFFPSQYSPVPTTPGSS